MLSINRADKEDHQLEDSKHQSVLRSASSFPLGLQIETQVTKRRSLGQKWMQQVFPQRRNMASYSLSTTEVFKY
jgi:hypothetical protein